MPRHSRVVGGTAADRWRNRVTAHDSNVVVALSNADLCDVDLEPLMAYLDSLLRDEIWPTYWMYSLDLDLSCNCGITDFGVTVHIMRLLGKWPACRRLKLYQTSIGDVALKALSPWVASGNAHELHLSDLGGTVTGETVLQLCRQIHWKGKYPYRTNRGHLAALWLRLEHNGIHNPDELVSAAQAEGMWVCALDKTDMATVRPGIAAPRGPHCNASINLVLFRMQNRKPPKQNDNVNFRQSLLTMLHVDCPSPQKPLRSEPLALSVDEYQLWVMEARENEESGANASNFDTFGDDADMGWSFEENVAANERLSIPTPKQPGVGPLASSHEGKKIRVAPGDARIEIEQEVQDILAVNPVLRRFDFDGSVRQHLHALRSIGGRAKVREAMLLIHSATRDKERTTIQKWPAYLLKLLKRFLRSPEAGDILNDGDQCAIAPVEPSPVLEDSSQSALTWLNSSLPLSTFQ